jgi:hypothetical protein
VEASNADVPAGKRQRALVKVTGKLLIQPMSDNPAVILSGWSLVESKFALMEWASLLNLNKELCPLLLQP